MLPRKHIGAEQPKAPNMPLPTNTERNFSEFASLFPSQFLIDHELDVSRSLSRRVQPPLAPGSGSSSGSRSGGAELHKMVANFPIELERCVGLSTATIEGPFGTASQTQNDEGKRDSNGDMWAMVAGQTQSAYKGNSCYGAQYSRYTRLGDREITSRNFAPPAVYFMIDSSKEELAPPPSPVETRKFYCWGVSRTIKRAVLGQMAIDPHGRSPQPPRPHQHQSPSAPGSERINDRHSIQMEVLQELPMLTSCRGILVSYPVLPDESGDDAIPPISRQKRTGPHATQSGVAPPVRVSEEDHTRTAQAPKGDSVRSMGAVRQAVLDMRVAKVKAFRLLEL
eukprot:GHVN01074504.1.p1 GENE.GHVN01074504.1~~GHVN01074504.1.p1  ORF type:complete len:347 (+),score=7.05 GHVN01074504.1:29-1042(+)